MVDAAVELIEPHRIWRFADAFIETVPVLDGLHKALEGGFRLIICALNDQIVVSRCDRLPSKRRDQFMEWRRSERLKQIVDVLLKVQKSGLVDGHRSDVGQGLRLQSSAQESVAN